jgi:hypothetical protein
VPLEAAQDVDVQARDAREAALGRHDASESRARDSFK